MTTPALALGYAPPTGLDLPKAFNFLNPLDALVGLPQPIGTYLLGGSSLEGSLRNFANPDAPLTPIGNPTINAVGATCSQIDGFSTGLAETDAFTMLAVVKAQAAAFDAMQTGRTATQAPRGVSLRFNQQGGHADPYGTASTSSVVVGYETNVSTGTGFLGSTDWVQIIVRGDATDVQASGQRNNSRYDAAAMATGTRGTNKRPYRIGAANILATAAGTTFEVLSAFVWDTRLSDADRNAVLAALRTWFNTGSGIGITTL